MFDDSSGAGGAGGAPPAQKEDGAATGEERASVATTGVDASTTQHLDDSDATAATAEEIKSRSEKKVVVGEANTSHRIITSPSEDDRIKHLDERIERKLHDDHLAMTPAPSSCENNLCGKHEIFRETLEGRIKKKLGEGVPPDITPVSSDETSCPQSPPAGDAAISFLDERIERKMQIDRSACSPSRQATNETDAQQAFEERIKQKIGGYATSPNSVAITTFGNHLELVDGAPPQPEILLLPTLPEPGATVHGVPEEATPGAGPNAHAHEKHRRTVIRPDGTIITSKRRKSLPDGSSISTTRTEKLIAATGSGVATTHVIQTRTKRINSDGTSSTTTTTEAMKENPPIVTTKVLPDGSRVIRSKQTTVGPVVVTTSIHLPAKAESNAEPHQDVVSAIEMCDDDGGPPMPPNFNYTREVDYEYNKEETKKTIETFEDDADAPMPPAYIGAVEDDGYGDEETHKKLQIEELPEEEPLSPFPLEDTEDCSVGKSRGIKASFRKLPRRRTAVALLPVETEANEGEDGVPGRPTPYPPPPSDEETLAIASPVNPEEEGTIYQAEKYTPSVRIPFYKRRKAMCITSFALLVCSIVVALSVVYATRGVVEKQTPPPIVDERATSGIQQFLQANALQRNASFDAIGKNDPRRLALDWILYADSVQLAVQDKRLTQRYILALLAFAFDSMAWTAPNATGLEDTHSVWLSSTDECRWMGVACHGGTVSGLVLNDNALIGDMPPELGKLNLTILSLRHNCLFGSIPREIGNMQSLKQLDLEYNGLRGAIPDELMDLKNLVKLNLAQQYFNEHECIRSDGTVVNTLYALGEEAYGENPGLEGEILGPKIGNLQSLKEIRISSNYFNGSIAPEIGRLKDLVILDAAANAFEGTIPQEITGLASLRELRLEENWFSGQLPEDIGDMKSLEALSLGFGYTVGNLGGTIPDSLYNLSNLRELRLNNNDPGFQGTLKTDIGRLTKLAYLDVGDNPLLTGTLPSELGLCEELSYLNLANTGIYGAVPQEVCDLREKKLHSENPLKEFFKADCSPSEGSSIPFFSCPCCNTCCEHKTKACIVFDN